MGLRKYPSGVGDSFVVTYSTGVNSAMPGSTPEQAAADAAMARTAKILRVLIGLKKLFRNIQNLYMLLWAGVGRISRIRVAGKGGPLLQHPLAQEVIRLGEGPPAAR